MLDLLAFAAVLHHAVVVVLAGYVVIGVDVSSFAGAFASTRCGNDVRGVLGAGKEQPALPFFFYAAMLVASFLGPGCRIPCISRPTGSGQRLTSDVVNGAPPWYQTATV